ncbi:MAG: tol-pal system protein YbgF [Deltaproteobacteria bacterium]|jgi:tol-pal system protein YbgF|nr:tol-pal system protein YbgF [Deltaproteobacteria bacterium]
MFSRKFLLVPLAASFLLSGCMTSQQDISAIYSRINNNEKQIRDISSQLNLSSDGVVPGQAEMWAQMQSMRQDLNQVLGQMADWNMQNAEGENFTQLRARVDRIEAAVRKMGSVLAIELPELEAPAGSDVTAGTMGAGGTAGFIGTNGAGGAVFASGTGAGATEAAGTPGVVAMAGSAAAAGTTEPAGSATPAEGGVAVSAGSAMSGAASGAGATVSTGDGAAPVAAQPMNQDNAELAAGLYNSGTKAFSERRYKDAVKIFQDFVKTYPTHRLTSNAHFWEGESHYQLKNYSSAILAYQQVIDNFPGSDKLQSAMFKQGVSMYQRGQRDAGKIRLNELIGKYPKSQEAGRAKQFLAENS